MSDAVFLRPADEVEIRAAPVWRTIPRNAKIYTLRNGVKSMANLKKRIEYIIKHNPVFQKLYIHSFSVAMRFSGLFMKTDDHLILFNSFAG